MAQFKVWTKEIIDENNKLKEEACQEKYELESLRLKFQQYRALSETKYEQPEIKKLRYQYNQKKIKRVKDI